jgi:large subunit ribosomal protein L9
LLKKAAEDRSTAEAQKEQMSSISLSFERKAGEGGTLFGSVTSMDIAEALQSKGYEIDRKRIILKDPIKETGDYTVKVKLHREVVLEVPVEVTAEGGEAADAKADKKQRKAKTAAEEAPVEPVAESVETAPEPEVTEEVSEVATEE